MATSDRDDELEEFEAWVGYMEEGLAEFTDLLPAAVVDQLDASAASLSVLEGWLLERYPDADATLPSSEARVLDGASRYVGETIRSVVGGEWSIEVDDDDYLFRGIPEVTGIAPDAPPTCPLSLVTAAVSRRRGDYLQSYLEYLVEEFR